MHPTGPRPPGVYWLRRIVVLVVILVLLLGVRWLLTGRGSSTPSASPTTSGTPAASESPTPAASSSPSVGPTKSASPSKTPSATPTGTGTCKDSQITVTASTDAASYPVGATPRLRMKIQNTSQTACKRDIGADKNELIITSGTAHVWSSDDCSAAGNAQVETIAPGQSFSVAVTWLGHLSQKGCPANQPAAVKGNYKLVGRNGTAASSPAAFSLT